MWCDCDCVVVGVCIVGVFLVVCCELLDEVVDE